MNCKEMEESSYGTFPGFITAFACGAEELDEKPQTNTSRTSQPVTSQIQTMGTNNSP
jgi:hypothetical protein